MPASPLPARGGSGARRFGLVRLISVLGAACALSGCAPARTGTIWDVYSVGNGPNSGIIWTEYGVIVVDTQETPDGGYLAQQYASQLSQRLWEALSRSRGNLAVKTAHPPVLYAMNTSHSAPRWFGNQGFAKAEIISSGATRRLMQENFDSLRREASGRHNRRELEDLKSTLPTLSVEGSGITLHTPQSDVRFIVLAKGAVPGQSVAWLESERVLFAGDLLPGSGVPDARGRDLEGWIEALSFAVKLDPARVVPGSGAPSDVRGLAALRNYLSRLWSEAGAKVQAGSPVEEAAAKLDLPEFKDWENYKVNHLGNAVEACRQWAESRARRP